MVLLALAVVGLLTVALVLLSCRSDPYGAVAPRKGAVLKIEPA